MLTEYLFVVFWPGIDEHGGLMLATPEGIVSYMRGTLRKV